MAQEWTCEEWRQFCSGYEPAGGGKIASRRHGAIGSRASFPAKTVYEQGKLVYTVANVSIGPQALEEMVKNKRVKLRRGFWPDFFKNTLKRQHTRGMEKQFRTALTKYLGLLASGAVTVAGFSGERRPW